MTDEATERFRRLEELFHAALDVPEGPEREAFLRDREALGPGLVEDVRTLIQNLGKVRTAAPEAAEVLPRFGAWQATRLLGRGGMGTVYQAERADGAFQMSVAVKVVPLALASPQIEERFRRERQFLASLDHPRIARLIDGGVTSSGLPYLVMDYIDGLTIDLYCKTHDCDARSVIGLIRQVLEALTYVHGSRVVHRDLKPSNILVDSTGSVKMLDFGIARLVDSGGDDAITKTGTFAFTPEYASPEQVSGQPVTFASDIYSLGVLLYRLLTGRRQIQLSNLHDSSLQTILSTALNKDPGHRYSSAAEMDADLARYLDGSPIPARRSWRLPVSIAVLLCVGAGSVWWLRYRPVAPRGPVSLAVLPFTDIYNDPANQYFVNGLSQEVYAELATLKTIQLAPPSAAVASSKPPRDIPAIGRKLNVTHLLEATVERAGDQVTIVASLERASDAAKLWTNTYRRRKADVPAIEFDLEAGIASTLGVAKPVPNKKHMPPEEAREFARKARFESDQLNVTSNALAQRDYRRALEIDPDFASAYQGLATTIWNRNIFGGERPVLAERREAERLFQKSIQLDPGFLPAHTSVGLYAMQYDWDWNRAEREFQTVLASGPSGAAESKLALLYLIVGRRREADEHMQRAQDLDAVSSLGSQNFEVFLLLEGRFAEAREECRKLIVRNPGSVNWRIQMNFLDALAGKRDAAVQNLRTLSRQEPDAAVLLAQLEAARGHREEALSILRPFEINYQTGKILLSDLAGVYAAMGDEPNTVKWLERSMEAREMPAIYIHTDPVYARMQNTPAFHRLKKRMNLDW
jgi:TolB-like protein/Tfp pilus assembly protein PilF